MIKLRYLRIFTILVLFIWGCSGIKHQTKTSSKRPRFIDPDIVAFMEEGRQSQDSLFLESSRFLRSSERRARPLWAQKNYMWFTDLDYIDRSAWGIIGTRKAQVVLDSIHRKLLTRIAGDIETRVDSWVEDSVYTKVMQRGGESDYVREHIFRTVSRHYHPTITFAREYYKPDHWKDLNSDTLWYYIRFDLKAYEKGVSDRLYKAWEEAFHYLKTAFEYYSIEGKMEQALKSLGAASYYISLGGGMSFNKNLFDVGGEPQYVGIQARDLLTEIRKDIKVRLLNPNEDLKATRDKGFVAKIYSENLKGLDLNGVRLRVQVEGDYLNYPAVVFIEADGSADVDFSINPEKENAYGKEVTITVTYDIISDLIPEQKWYEKKGYRDLLEELPSLTFSLALKEFASKETWAIVNENLPEQLKEKENILQKRLEIALGRHPGFFNIIPYKNWAVSYEKVRKAKSGISVYLTTSEKMDMQDHDLDVLLTVHESEDDVFTLLLEVSSPVGGGILSSFIDAVPFKEVISSAIDRLVTRFVEENFQRQVKAKKAEDKNIEVYINDEKISPINENDREMILGGRSRFTTENLVAKSKGFRRQKFSIPGRPFSLRILPNEIYLISIRRFEREQGTLHVSVIDSLTGEPVRHRRGYRRGGRPPKITVKRRLWMFPDPFTKKMVSDTSAVASFVIDKLGKYYVSVSKQFYSPVLPQFCTVVDDEDPNAAVTNNIRFVLERKSKRLARTLSMIVPGSGQWYLGKRTQALGFFTGILVSAIWGYYEYGEFIKTSDSFDRRKNDYEDSQDSGEWERLEIELGELQDSIRNHRYQVIGSLSLYGAIWGFNLFTVTF